MATNWKIYLGNVMLSWGSTSEPCPEPVCAVDAEFKWYFTAWFNAIQSWLQAITLSWNAYWFETLPAITDWRITNKTISFNSYSFISEPAIIDWRIAKNNSFNSWTV